MRIFITGICGFIGTELANKLIDQGFTVIGGDMSPRNLKLKTEAEYIQMNFKYRYSDNFKIFEDIDLIYHLASPIGVKNILENSAATLRDATTINDNMDYVGNTYNIPIVYASSSEVFGSQHVTEDSKYNIKQFTDSPRWSYAASKVYGEFLFSSAIYPSLIIRFFNVVGPGQITDGMVVPTFIKQARKNEPLHLIENGIRNYCDIRSAIDQIIPIGINLAKEREDSIYNKKSYNISSLEQDNSIDVVELSLIITEVFSSESVIDQKQTTSETLKRRTLDFDDDLLDLDVATYSIREIIENIKDSIVEEDDEIKTAEDDYKHSLDAALGV